MPDIKIKQIVVDVDGELCGVALPEGKLDILAGFIADLSDGPIKVFRLPGVKMVPLGEWVENS